MVWVYLSEDAIHCPVRLIQKYMSLCLPNGKRNNFYMQSLQRPTPRRWYSNQVVGQNSLSKVVKQMMKEANIEGFFTNHSLCRTEGTRFFRGGIDRKLIKETTGHWSDSVDAYQITVLVMSRGQKIVRSLGMVLWQKLVRTQSQTSLSKKKNNEDERC